MDNALIDHFIEEIKREQNVDVSKDEKSLAKLRKYAREAKESLSCADATDINIEGLKGGIEFEYELTRAVFEEVC